MTITRDDLDRRFGYRQPSSDEVVHAHEELRGACKALAVLINQLVPDGREKSTAVTKVEEALMWANAGIARSQLRE